MSSTEPSEISFGNSKAMPLGPLASTVTWKRSPMETLEVLGRTSMMGSGTLAWASARTRESLRRGVNGASPGP